MRDTDYNDLADWLAEIESTTGPAGFHGQLTGLWCRLSELPADLALDEVDREVPAWSALQQFAAEVKASLDDSDCAFEPILPPDSAPLGLRTEAMADWCEGLLFGIGAAGELKRDAVSDDVQELLRDLAEICKVSTAEAGGDADEESYAEILEYLRVAAQTLYVELHPQAD